MKAFSMTQPWATLVAIGAKKIETRSFKTNYRGPVAIHAAKRFPRDIQTLCYTPVFWDALDKGLKRDYPESTKAIAKFLPLGMVVAVCELRVCTVIPAVQLHGVSGGVQIKLPPDEPELSFGDYTPGRFAWFLCNVRALPEPIPAKGALSLWEWTPPEGFAL